MVYSVRSGLYRIVPTGSTVTAMKVYLLPVCILMCPSASMPCQQLYLLEQAVRGTLTSSGFRNCRWNSLLLILAVELTSSGFRNCRWNSLLLILALLSITFLGTGGFLVIRYKLFKMAVC